MNICSLLANKTNIVLVCIIFFIVLLTVVITFSDLSKKE